MTSNMADCSSSSDSATSLSDYSDVEELLKCEAAPSIGQPFTGIQPGRFEPPGRSSESVYGRPGAMTVKRRENFQFKIRTTKQRTVKSCAKLACNFFRRRLNC